MSEDWSDPRVPKLFFRPVKAPSPFETEAFVSRVMGRLEEKRSPLLQWLTLRWTVPALGLGVAAVFLSILYSVPAGTLVLDASVSADAPSSWVVALDEEP